jgi:hypothetical protein
MASAKHAELVGDSLCTTSEILSALEPVAWARRLRQLIEEEARRASGERLIEPLLFEARFAIALHDAGVEARYEYSLGVGGSTVDFMLPGKSGQPGWLVELVSIRESEHVSAATVTTDLAGGTLSELILRSDDPNVRQTPASELVRLIEKIGDKVFDRRTRMPTKFPEPNGEFFQMVLADTRGFEGIGAPDTSHLLHVVHGSQDPRIPDAFREHNPTTGEAILGLFQPENNRPAALAARTRLHYLGFVNEQTFKRGELPAESRFFRNPQLLDESVLDSYPVHRAHGATG